MQQGFQPGGILYVPFTISVGPLSDKRNPIAVCGNSNVLSAQMVKVQSPAGIPFTKFPWNGHANRLESDFFQNYYSMFGYSTEVYQFSRALSEEGVYS